MVAITPPVFSTLDLLSIFYYFPFTPFCTEKKIQMGKRLQNEKIHSTRVVNSVKSFSYFWQKGVPLVCRNGFYLTTSGSSSACTVILVELPSFTGTCAKTHSFKLHSGGPQSEATIFPKQFEVTDWSNQKKCHFVFS